MGIFGWFSIVIWGYAPARQPGRHFDMDRSQACGKGGRRVSTGTPDVSTSIRRAGAWRLRPSCQSLAASSTVRPAPAWRARAWASHAAALFRQTRGHLSWLAETSACMLQMLADAAEPEHLQ